MTLLMSFTWFPFFGIVAARRQLALSGARPGPPGEIERMVADD